MNCSRYQNNKNKYLNCKRENKTLKVKNNLLEDFKKSKDRKLKDREIKIRGAIRIWRKKSENMSNLFRLERENEAIKDRIIRDIKTFFERHEDYYKPARVGNFWSNNYIEYGSNRDRNQTLSIKEYLDKIKPSDFKVERYHK